MSQLLHTAIYITMISYAAAMLAALWRALRGPSAQDRVVAVDFIGIAGMMLIMTVGILYNSSTYFEPALLLALFGFVSSAVCAKFLLRGEVIE